MQSSPSHPSQNQPSQTENGRPGTPPRPPYSPVTPVFAHLAPSNGLSNPIIPPPVHTSPSPTNTTNVPNIPPPPTFPATPRPSFAPEPAPVPISESDNPDAIALRSALSILQLQKQQSLRDIQTLERMKRAAAADPESFAKELAAGNLTAGDKGGFINLDHAETDGESSLGKIPTPQNVVRMPPINWAKYGVVGEPLDRMHEDQLRRPDGGVPRRESGQVQSQRAEHVLASPYRPLVDKLEDGRGGVKNKKS